MHIPSYTSYPGPDTGLSTLTFLEGPVIQGGPGPPPKKKREKKEKKEEGPRFFRSRGARIFCIRPWSYQYEQDLFSGKTVALSNPRYG